MAPLVRVPFAFLVIPGKELAFRQSEEFQSAEAGAQALTISLERPRGASSLSSAARTFSRSIDLAARSLIGANTCEIQAAIYLLHLDYVRL